MRSPRGFVGASALLLALPVAAVSEMLFPDSAKAMVHLLFGGGAWLISWSVGDFRLPGWIQWAARLSNLALGGLFLLQGASEILASPALTHLAYETLGQRLEAWLVSLFLLWCVALLFIDSRGKVRTLGFLLVTLVACVDVYSHVLPYAGSSLNEASPGLKILYLLLPAWLLLESGKVGEPPAAARLSPTR